MSENVNLSLCPESPVTSSASFGTIAALWEHRPECLQRVSAQVKAIHDKLVEWGFDTDEESLGHATIAYSKACSNYECVEWLPFDVMPGWEDDLWCILMVKISGTNSGNSTRWATTSPT